MLTKLGKSTAFIGKVGDNLLDHMLKAREDALGINTQGLQIDSAADITLAFVQNAFNGECSFSFFKRADELNRDALTSCRIFHFGSLSLTHEPARIATRQVVALAKKAGARILFNPL